MSKDKSSQPAAANPYANAPFTTPAHPATNPYGANPGGNALSPFQFGTPGSASTAPGNAFSTGQGGDPTAKGNGGNPFGVGTGGAPTNGVANPYSGTPSMSAAGAPGNPGTPGNPGNPGNPGVDGGTITAGEAQSGQFTQNAVQLWGPTAALYGVPNGGYYYGPGVKGPGTPAPKPFKIPASQNPYAVPAGANPFGTPAGAPASGSPPPAAGSPPPTGNNPYSFPAGANPFGGSPSTGAPSTGTPSRGAPTGSPSSAPAGQVAGGTAPPPPIPYGNVQNTLNTSNVPSLVGGDALAQQMQQAQQAAYKQATAYLDPQWANAQRDLETRLANQGIPVGSEAYTRATDEFNRNKAFAYSQAEQSAVQQGNTAQQQLYGEGLASNQNAFGQSLSGGQFSNSAEQQVAQQILANLGFNEQVNQNNFTNSMDTRRQDINELLLQQQNPLQMFQALTGGNNISTPNFSATPGTNVGGTDIVSIIAQALQQGNNTYNTQVGSQNSQTSAYATILAALLSDRRFKRNVRMIGMHEVGVPLYTFDYVWGTPGIGVMADEVAKVRPHAVITLPNGVQAVNYAEFSEVA